jgi:hypothetical protein
MAATSSKESAPSPSASVIANIIFIAWPRMPIIGIPPIMPWPIIPD